MKKELKKMDLIAVIAALIGILSVFTACDQPDEKIAVASVTLNKTSLTMNIGDEETLTAVIAPSNATNQNVEWLSSAPAVVSVSNGKVTALTAGSGTITVKTQDGGKIATCAVEVTNVTPPNTAATPTATPAAGEVADNTAITLATATTGAKLYYTQDGTEPDTTSTPYSDSDKPVITTGKLTLKAIAVKDGMNNSKTLTAVYTIAGAHIHQWGNWGNSTATCTETGVETRVCTLDTSHTETRDIAALGHDYGDWTITSPATQTTEGVETRTCAHDATHTETRAVSRIPFTDVDELGTWLTSQTANDKDTLFNITLNIDDEDDFATLLTTLKSATDKYVYLDLSGSTITTISDNTTWTTGPATLIGIIIPNNVTSIGEGAFYGCTNLASVTIPNSVINIVDYAFIECPSLIAINVDIDNTTYSSDNGVLYNKAKTALIQYPAGKKDSSFTIPNSVISIGNGTFYGCANLTSVTIQEGVTSIGEAVFQNCTNLTSVTIPNSVTNIGNNTFYGCTNLTAITVDTGNSAYTAENNVLYNKNKTTLIQYLAKKADASFTIPNSVTSIGIYAFYECTNLTSVIIPNSVTSIGKWAFAWCNNLISVKFEGTIASSNFDTLVFYYIGDLRAKFYATDSTNGTPGTYTTTTPVNGSSVWTRVDD